MRRHIRCRSELAVNIALSHGSCRCSELEVSRVSIGYVPNVYRAEVVNT